MHHLVVLCAFSCTLDLVALEIDHLYGRAAKASVSEFYIC